ncbi:MAG: hypothetical protein EHJ95_03520 [Methanobacteriota archaeon]|nr:MAG: hypothetical protein EHJ95_03520 [Euryarchaeota archaeon]
MASGTRTSITCFILCLVLLFCLIPIGSAYAVKTVALIPSSTPRAGEVVTLTATITLHGSSGKSFESDHDLVFATDLERPMWTIGCSRDGFYEAAITVEGATARLDGSTLACTSGQTLICTVTVEGTAPLEAESSEITAIAIQETDADGEPVQGGSYEKTIEVVCGATLDALIEEEEGMLATLRLLMGSKARGGVDISAAEAKHADARDALACASAAQTCSAAYAELAKAQKYTAEVGPLLDLAVEEFERGAAAATTTSGTPAPEGTVSGMAAIATLQHQPAADGTAAPTATPASADTHDRRDGAAGKGTDAANQAKGIFDQIVGLFRGLLGWAGIPSIQR